MVKLLWQGFDIERLRPEHLRRKNSTFLKFEKSSSETKLAWIQVTFKFERNHEKSATWKSVTLRTVSFLRLLPSLIYWVGILARPFWHKTPWRNLQGSSNWNIFTVNHGRVLFILEFTSQKCVKSVQIRSFFWSVFSSIQTEYGEIQTKYGEILCIPPYSVWMRENTCQKNSVFGHFSRCESLTYECHFGNHH